MIGYIGNGQYKAIIYHVEKRGDFWFAEMRTRDKKGLPIRATNEYGHKPEIGAIETITEARITK